MNGLSVTRPKLVSKKWTSGRRSRRSSMRSICILIRILHSAFERPYPFVRGT